MASLFVEGLLVALSGAVLAEKAAAASPRAVAAPQLLREAA